MKNAMQEVNLKMSEQRGNNTAEKKRNTIEAKCLLLELVHIRKFEFVFLFRHRCPLCEKAYCQFDLEEYRRSVIVGALLSNEESTAKFLTTKLCKS
jgi:hypothetical protein